MKRLLPISILTAAMIGLMACQSLPTLDSKLLEIESQVTATETSAANAVSLGVMTTTQRDQVRAYAAEVMTAVKGARQAEHAGDMSTAQGKFTIASNLRVQLSQYAATHGAGAQP